MNCINVGVIGTGFIGPVHIEALRRLGFVNVVALSDVSQKIAEEKAGQLGIAKAYGNFEDLINDPEVDSVHICTPNNLHFMMVKAAIAAGKHVVCDKPMAIKVQEAEELVKLAKKREVVAAMNFNIRSYPLIHQAKAMIEKGDLGEIFAINGSYQQDWLQKETDYSWRLEPSKTGNSRAVSDIGSHWIDCIEFITGLKIKKVCADFAIFFPSRKKPLKAIETYSGKILKSEDYKDVKIVTEDYATILLKFDNRAHGSLTVNQVAAGRKNRMYFEIYGSKASLVFDSERCNELWIGKREGNNEIMMKDPSLAYPYAADLMNYPGGHNEGFADTFKQCFKKIYTYIINDGIKNNLPVDFPSFEDGLREMSICELIVESAKKETWIDV